MRLPKFEYLCPDTLDGALELLATHGQDAKILAGGTDLLVRMKKGLLRPIFIISLNALNELSYIKIEDGALKIGARTSIANIIASDQIQKQAPALCQACEKIGAATIQHYRGTIGGNILQDNRCIHYNQSGFFRSGRQACHKAGGKICYARQEADRCNSTCQSDGATALMALGAKLTLTSKGSERTVDLTDFYTTDGIHPFAMESHELLTQITIPTGMGQSSYHRLAYRSAIDYPIVCAGVQLKIFPDKTISDARIVVGAMGRSPLLLARASADLNGRQTHDKEAFKQAADAAMNSAAAFAVHNVGASLDYRCAMVSVMVKKALEEAANDGAV